MKLLVNSKDFLVTQIKISEINRNKKNRISYKIILGCIWTLRCHQTCCSGTQNLSIRLPITLQ